MDPELLTTRALRELGVGPAGIDHFLAAGDIERLHRGVFIRTEPAAAPPERRHALSVRARLACELSPVVASHLSAAVMHGWPVWRADDLDVVHLSRNRTYGGRRRRGLVVHGTRLADDEITHADGVPVTSPARTVVDVARTTGRRQAIVVADAALAAGLSRTELEDAIARADGWPGIRQARALCRCADSRSESPGESVSRLVIADHGLPAPELQRWITDRAGRRLGRVDFCWPERRVVGEFDGRRKYADPYTEGDDVVDVVLAEKAREDAIRAERWQVIRWTTADLADPRRLVARLRRLLESSYTP